jgi:hypothetical protein
MRSGAAVAALALATTTTVAHALTVDFESLPIGNAEQVLLADVSKDARAHKQELDEFEVKNGTLELTDEHEDETVCFSERQRNQRDRWPLSFATEVKAEQIVDKRGKTAVLRVRHLSIDSARGKAFLLEARELPLERVAEAPTGVTIYAMRDDGDTVQFLIASPQRPERLRKGRQIDDTQLVLGDGSQQFTNSACGHVRVPLRASSKRPAAATVRNTVILSHTERPHGATADVRVRGMYSHLNVSKLGDDDKPVVSVSFGWATTESIVEVVLDEE